jgi:hypothetical protein
VASETPGDEVLPAHGKLPLASRTQSLLKCEKKEKRKRFQRSLASVSKRLADLRGQTSGYSVRCGTQDGLSASCEDSPAACRTLQVCPAS